MRDAYLALVLNAHLPFVRKPEFSRFFEERWLFEAVSETYLPLLRVFRRLEADEIPFTLTMSLSPTLAAMLGDSLLAERYLGYLDGQIALAARERERVAGDGDFGPLVDMYAELYRRDREDFEGLYGRNLLGAFDYYYKKGRVELITTAATHAFLPAYRSEPALLAAQLETALVSHRASFGKHPSGFWLPHLGFYPGLDRLLKAYNLQYGVVTTRGGLLGDPEPAYASFAPVRTPSGFHAFIRDAAATEAVWAEDSGYPADPVHRDFYRDIGYDLPLDYLKPWLEEAGSRIYTGFKYWAVTGKTDQKRPYRPEAAQARAREQARDFVDGRLELAEEARPHMDRPPLMVCPYDAELFGHWWHEGPTWLEAVFREAATRPGLGLVSLSEYLKLHPENPPSMPEFSSWGDGGYGEVWLDGSNDWLYRHSFKATERMTELAERFPNESGLRERILNQAAREVLLATCSDWPLLMRKGASAAFARRQVEDALANFERTYEMLSANTVDTEWLTKLEKRDNLFRGINYRVFRRKR